jgi:hypothetical protein
LKQPEARFASGTQAILLCWLNRPSLYLVSKITVQRKENRAELLSFLNHQWIFRADWKYISQHSHRMPASDEVA